MTDYNLGQKKMLLFLSVAIAGLLSIGLMTAPVMADTQSTGQATLASGVDLCGDEGAEDASDTIQTVFTIMSILGPVFGTLFYVGLSVAGAASIKDKYQEERRRVLLLGFSVPIAIAFLGTIAGQIVPGDTDVDCFFPDQVN